MVDAHALPLSSDRRAAGRLMRQAAIASMSVAVILIAAKAVAWVATDSLGMLSSLVDSSLDFVSSLITFVAIRHALVPADADHSFGHGKAEALAGMAQAGFIAASAAGLMLTVVDRVLHPHPMQQEMVGIVVSGLAVMLTMALVAFQNRVIRRTGSLAIGADRAHYTTDLITNVAVGVGLFLSGWLGEPLIDLGVALGVAVYLVVGAWHIGHQSVDVLMDRELPDAERQQILAIVRSYPGVREAHDLRTRSGGLTKFIQLHIVLDPTMSLGRAHAVGDHVEMAIQQAFPSAEIILHVDPWDDRDPAAKAPS